MIIIRDIILYFIKKKYIFVRGVRVLIQVTLGNFYNISQPYGAKC